MAQNSCESPLKPPTGIDHTWRGVPDESDNRRLASLRAAAVYAGVHDDTIRRRIRDGQLTAYRFGPKMIRIDLNELDALLRPISTTQTA